MIRFANPPTKAERRFLDAKISNIINNNKNNCIQKQGSVSKATVTQKGKGKKKPNNISR